MMSRSRDGRVDVHQVVGSMGERDISAIEVRADIFRTRDDQRPIVDEFIDDPNLEARLALG